MIMTVKKLSCWFNSGWSHLQSAGEDVSLKSMCFLRSRQFVNEMPGWSRGVMTRKLAPKDLTTGRQAEGTVWYLWVYTCNAKFRLYNISPIMSWPTKCGASETKLTVGCDNCHSGTKNDTTSWTPHHVWKLVFCYVMRHWPTGAQRRKSEITFSFSEHFLITL